MQFCRTCGTDLSGLADARAAPPPLPSAAPATAYQGAAAPARAPDAARALVNCARCGGANEAGSRYCKYCGAQVEAGAAAGAAANPLAPTQPLRGQVVVIQRDGSEGSVYPLDSGYTDVGSRDGEIVLPDDPYLSPRHARIERRGDTFVLRDLGSLNGIYVRLREPVELTDGAMFLIGQQVLRFEMFPEAERRVGPAKQHGVMVFGTPELPRLARVVQYTTEGLERDVYYLYRDETVFGREQADVVFAEDPFLSRRHAALSMDRDRLRFVLRDLGSSNGTAIRCRGERTLQHGDQFRLGRHLFRFDLSSGGGRNPG
jgi:pSer/pThr/pTyr-binding forkhead associated (FHA) protein